MEITYIAMAKGFVNLAAALDSLKSAAKPRNQIGQSFVRQILPFLILEFLGSVTWSRSLNGVSRCARSL